MLPNLRRGTEGARSEGKSDKVSAAEVLQEESLKDRDYSQAWKKPRPYWVKDFGVDISTLQFNRWPRVIERARAAVTEEVVGFLLCALERSPRTTGLLSGDVISGLPDGLPIHTPSIESRHWRRGFQVVVAEDSGTFVISHWLHENGELDRFDRVH
jgi:hypothetical protein